MRRLQLGLVAFAVPMLAVSLVLVGCGKPSEEGGGTPAPKGGGEKGKQTGAKGKGEMVPVKAEGKGTLKGKVVLKGSPPDFAKLNADIKKEIEKKPEDKAVCLSGRPEEVDEQSYKIGDNRNVANVF